MTSFEDQGESTVPVILRCKQPDEPSAFEPRALLREARRAVLVA